MEVASPIIPSSLPIPSSCDVNPLMVDSSSMETGNPSSSSSSFSSSSPLSSSSFLTSPPRSFSWSPLAPSVGDEFMSLSSWLSACVEPIGVASIRPNSNSAAAAEEEEAEEEAFNEIDHHRQQMKQTLLLTSIYHSAPYHILRLILDELAIPPPPVRSSVFSHESSEEEDDDDDDAAREYEEFDSIPCTPISPSSSSSRSKRSSRPLRSADVAISTGAPTTTTTRTASQLQPAMFDPLSVTGSLSSASSSTATSPHHHITPSTSSNSIVSATSTSAPFPSIASTVSMSSISSTGTSPNCLSHTSSPLPTMSMHDHHIHHHHHHHHHRKPMQSNLKSTPSIQVSSSSANSAGRHSCSAVGRISRRHRPSAYLLWHIRKLNTLLLLRDWVVHFPHDFCAFPSAYQPSPPTPIPSLSQSHPSSTVSAAVPTDSSASPPKRLLEELLYQELKSFPPQRWFDIASENDAAFRLEADRVTNSHNLSSASSFASTIDSASGSHVSPPPPPSRSVGSATATAAASYLTRPCVEAFRSLACALLQEYEEARLRYRGTNDDLPSPIRPHQHFSTPSSSFSSSSAATTAAVTTRPTAAHSTVVPSSSSSYSATRPVSASRVTTSSSTSPWHRSWGCSNDLTNGSIERNLSSDKIRRMMAMDDAPMSTSSGSGSTTLSTSGSVSVPAPLSRAKTLTSIFSASPLTPLSTLLQRSAPSSAASSSSAYPMTPASQVALKKEKFTKDFLATHPRDYAHALTWLAIQRMEEIGECIIPKSSIDPVETDLSASSSSSSSLISYHIPAPLPSAGYLRMFLRMPPSISKRQMKISNTMSCFVATTILNASTVALRKQMIQHWLHIAEACIGASTLAAISATSSSSDSTTTTTTTTSSSAASSTGSASSSSSSTSSASSSTPSVTNFMHAFEIIYGINHQSVYRLPAAQVTPTSHGATKSSASSSSDKTVLPLLHKRNFLSSHTHQIYLALTKLTSPNQNYSHYRRKLNELLDTLPSPLAAPSASSSHNTPAVPSSTDGNKAASSVPKAAHVILPYLGILLKDLVSLEEAGKPLVGVLGDSSANEIEGGHGRSVSGLTTDVTSTAIAPVLSTPSPPVNPSASEDSTSAPVVPSSPTLSDLSVSTSVSSLDSMSLDSSASSTWNDSFLVRPRRNATLTEPERRRPTLAQTQIQTQTQTQAHKQGTSIHPSPNELDSSSRQQDKRQSLLLMLTDHHGDSVSSSLISLSASSLAPSNSSFPPPKRSHVGASSGGGGGGGASLLTAALPQRHSLASASLVARSLAPTQFMVNVIKLSKIYALVESTLRCRLFFPTVPDDDEDDIIREHVDEYELPRSRTRSMTIAAHRYDRASSQSGMAGGGGGAYNQPFARVLSEMALTRHHIGLVRNRQDASKTSIPPPTFPFDRRLQHFLLHSMLTLTLKEEAQLMERSYANFPRKTHNTHATM